MIFQPSCQIGRPAEIEQRNSSGEDCVYSQVLQLLQQQGMYTGNCGIAQGGAAAVELAVGGSMPHTTAAEFLARPCRHTVKCMHIA